MKSLLKDAKDILINAALLAFIFGALGYNFVRATDEPTAIKSAENIELQCREFHQYRTGEFHRDNSDWCGHGEGGE